MLIFVSCNKQAEITSIPLMVNMECIDSIQVTNQIVVDTLQLENEMLERQAENLRWVLNKEKQKRNQVLIDVAFLITEEILLLDAERQVSTNQKDIDNYTFCIQRFQFIQSELNKK